VKYLVYPHPVLEPRLSLLDYTYPHDSQDHHTAKMISTKTLFTGSALYATTTAFCAAWVCYALPVQHNKVGPFNYHRAGKITRRFGERVPWRRLPKAL